MSVSKLKRHSFIQISITNPFGPSSHSQPSPPPLTICLLSPSQSGQLHHARPKPIWIESPPMAQSISLIYASHLKLVLIRHRRVSHGKYGILVSRSATRLLRIQAVQENGGPKRLVDKFENCA